MNYDIRPEDDNDSMKITKDLGQNESISTNFFVNDGFFIWGNDKINENNNNEIQIDTNIELNKYFNEKTVSSSKRSFETSNLIIEKNNNFQININSKKVTELNIKKVDKKSKQEKRLLGRKKNNSNEIGKHNRNTDDNLIRKCKHIILENAFKSINATIKKLYHNNIGAGDNKKELKKINQGQIVSSKADYNKGFLNKTMKDIFSDNISTKYSRYSLDYNKILIQKLLNEEDEEKRRIFKTIFNLTFLDCIKYFRGDINIQELEGFIKLDEACFPFKDDENYMIKFKNFILNYEENIMSKKLRNKEK